MFTRRSVDCFACYMEMCSSVLFRQSFVFHCLHSTFSTRFIPHTLPPHFHFPQSLFFVLQISAFLILHQTSSHLPHPPFPPFSFSTLLTFHTPHFPDPSLFTPLIFHTPHFSHSSFFTLTHFPHPSFSTLLIFHTPHFSHSSFSMLLTFHTIYFPHSSFSTLPFSTVLIFRTPDFPHSLFCTEHLSCARLMQFLFA